MSGASSGAGAPGPRIEIGHGGGGVLSRELVERVFRPAFANPILDPLGDAALLPGALAAPGERLAFATDAHVVQPLFFPGGSIGALAVNGTVNDLAMAGARPRYLSAAFVLEEGLPIELLERAVAAMATAARTAGVAVVTGDTKVVERSRGDGLVIVTSGLGVIPAGRLLGAEPPRAGDALLVSGPVGSHGMAVLAARGDLALDAAIESDCAPLAGAVEALLAACPRTRLLRDPTRGGVAAALNEIAASAAIAIEIGPEGVPVEPAVAAACELLGLDPLSVASEGRFLAVVPEADAAAALAALRAHPLGTRAAQIGAVVAGRPGTVVARSPYGGRRLVPMPLGEQLPRIC